MAPRRPGHSRPGHSGHFPFRYTLYGQWCYGPQLGQPPEPPPCPVVRQPIAEEQIKTATNNIKTLIFDIFVILHETNRLNCAASVRLKHDRRKQNCKLEQRDLCYLLTMASAVQGFARGHTVRGESSP